MPPDHVLIDGNIVPKDLPCPGEAVIGGDGLSLSIAAASIVAKVTRDRMCEIMHCEEPHFGFAGHKGYSTPGAFRGARRAWARAASPHGFRALRRGAARCGPADGTRPMSA